MEKLNKKDVEVKDTKKKTTTKESKNVTELKTKDDVKALNLVTNVVPSKNHKTENKKDITTTELKNIEKEEIKKDSITLNNRARYVDNYKILEDAFNDTLKSILIPGKLNKIGSYSIYIAMRFLIKNNKVDLLKELKEKYLDLYQQQLHHMNKGEKKFIEDNIK